MSNHSDDNLVFKALANENRRQILDERQVPRWLSLNIRDFSAKVMNMPEREDIDVTLNEQLIVEYYSR